MQLQKLSPFSGAPVRRQSVRVCASAVAQPAALPVKSADGSDKGTADLALRVAGEDTAKALVHRYMVLVQQNARRVRKLRSAIEQVLCLDWRMQCTLLF